MNSSRSAYACFLFAPLFFQQYQAATPGQDQLRCKILMKVRWVPQQWQGTPPRKRSWQCSLLWGTQQVPVGGEMYTGAIRCRTQSLAE